MCNISVEINNGSIDDVIALISEITKEIAETQGAVLQDESKKKSWFKRIVDACTFSKDKQKAVFRDIRDTNVLLQLLTVLSKKIYEDNQQVANEFAVCLRENCEEITGLKQRVAQLENFIYTKKHNIYDISILPHDEKETLNCVINTIFSGFSELSEDAKQFHTALRLFLGVDCDTVDLIENPDEELSELKNPKLFYYCILVAISFIDKELNEESLLEFNELLKELEVGEQTKKEIRDTILTSIKGLGQQYFIDRYKQVETAVDDRLDERFFELDLIADSDLEVDNSATVSDDETVVSESSPFAYTSEPIVDISVLREETLSGNLAICAGEEKVFRGMNLHLQNTITCDGTLIFDSCVINLNETIAFPSINVSAAGKLKIVNCKILNHKKKEQFFISVENNDDSFAIEFENCSFINCNKFIECHGRDVKIVKCKITQCPIDFIVHANNCIIDTSVIGVDYGFIDGFHFNDFIIDATGIALFNCHISFANRTRDAEKVYLFSNIISMNNCVVNNAYKLNYSRRKRNNETDIFVKNTFFEDCEDISIDGTFDCCEFVNSNYVRGLESVNSSFYECRNLDLERITNCEFCRCAFWSFGCEAFDSFFEDCPVLELRKINNCLFVGCSHCYTGYSMEDSTFVSCYDCICDSPSGKIKNCVFVNCHATSGNALFVVDCVYDLELSDVKFYNCKVDKNAFFFTNKKLASIINAPRLVNCQFLNCQSENEDAQIIFEKKVLKQSWLEKKRGKYRFYKGSLFCMIDCIGVDSVNQIDERIVLPQIPQMPNRDYDTGYTKNVEGYLLFVLNNNDFPFCKI